MSQSSSPFLYSRLPVGPGEIRVFDLFPGSGKDALSGALKCVRLCGKPSYEAVSYVWGSADKTGRLMCNGEILHVTGSMAEVLVRFR